MRNDCRISVRMIADELNINRETTINFCGRCEDEESLCGMTSNSSTNDQLQRRKEVALIFCNELRMMNGSTVGVIFGLISM